MEGNLFSQSTFSILCCTISVTLHKCIGLVYSAFYSVSLGCYMLQSCFNPVSVGYPNSN